MTPRRLTALAIAAALVPLGGCEDGLGSDPSAAPTAGTPSIPAAAPQASPAFREWPEIPAPPVGEMMSHTAGGFRQEAYYRAAPAGPSRSSSTPAAPRTRSTSASSSPSPAGDPSG